MNPGLGGAPAGVWAEVVAWASRWAGGMAWWQWCLLGLSVPLVMGGFWTLSRARSVSREVIDAARRNGPHAGPEAAPALGGPLSWLDGLSVNTVLAAAVAQLAVGVHFIAWSMPAGFDHPFLSARWWWALVLGCVLALGLSVALDRWTTGPRRQGLD